MVRLMGPIWLLLTLVAAASDGHVVSARSCAGGRDGGVHGVTLLTHMPASFDPCLPVKNHWPPPSHTHTASIPENPRHSRHFGSASRGGGAGGYRFFWTECGLNW
jgi:hypothetical protein